MQSAEALCEELEALEPVFLPGLVERCPGCPIVEAGPRAWRDAERVEEAVRDRFVGQ
jgi:hypothetical protein